MMIECRNVNDWMMLLAEAMSDGDDYQIMQLADISQGWLQPEEEMNAQVALCHSALELIDQTLDSD